jgi:hypothetical protein
MSEALCWIDMASDMKFAVILPLCAYLLASTVIYVLAIRSIADSSSSSATVREPPSFSSFLAMRNKRILSFVVFSRCCEHQYRSLYCSVWRGCAACLCLCSITSLLHMHLMCWSDCKGYVSVLVCQSSKIYILSPFHSSNQVFLWYFHCWAHRNVREAYSNIFYRIWPAKDKNFAIRKSTTARKRSIDIHDSLFCPYLYYFGYYSIAPSQNETNECVNIQHHLN